MSYLFRIGTAGDKGKWQRFGWDSLIEYAKQHNVEIVYIDTSKPIEEQGKFDIIVQKLIYNIGENPMDNPEYRIVYEYIQNHPEIKLIDNFDMMLIINDREKLSNVLKTIKWPDTINIRYPKSVMLYANDIDTIKKATENMKYPILAKPKLAGTVPAAHLMRMTSSPEALVGITVPCLLQEFINHGSVVYKVYVIGKHIEVTARTSIRDIKPEENIEINFHSQKSTEENGLWDHSIDLKEVKIPLDDLQIISDALTKSLKMHLIGFDIIIDKNNNYWIIDVNYYPGYKMVDNLQEKFFNFLSDIYYGRQ